SFSTFNPLCLTFRHCETAKPSWQSSNAVRRLLFANLLFNKRLCRLTGLTSPTARPNLLRAMHSHRYACFASKTSFSRNDKF
ncbi:MAG: hypothetical protein IJT33_08895, partial [Campylobacter sp.]|nr:hypothetical protein [Campylobacter sp.]